MKNIEEVKNGLVEQFEQKVYNFNLIVEDDFSNNAVFLVQRTYVYEKKDVEKIKNMDAFIKREYKKFVKEMIEEQFFRPLDFDSKYHFDYKNEFGTGKSGIPFSLTPADETMEEFLSSDLFIDDYNISKGIRD